MRHPDTIAAQGVGVMLKGIRVFPSSSPMIRIVIGGHNAVQRVHKQVQVAE
jgi:hypothetical protein